MAERPETAVVQSEQAAAHSAQAAGLSGQAAVRSAQAAENQEMVVRPETAADRLASVAGRREKAGWRATAGSPAMVAPRVTVAGCRAACRAAG